MRRHAAACRRGRSTRGLALELCKRNGVPGPATTPAARVSAAHRARCCAAARRLADNACTITPEGSPSKKYGDSRTTGWAAAINVYASMLTGADRVKVFVLFDRDGST